MKKEIADKWVEALRSGNYKQGGGRLRQDGRYCCLGVLCEISGVGRWVDDNYFGDSSYDGQNAILPDSVIKYTGMDSNSGIIAAMHTNLAGLNDNGATFVDIAEIIEKNWEKL